MWEWGGSGSRGGDIVEFPPEGSQVEAVLHLEGVEAALVPQAVLLQAAPYELHGKARGVHLGAGVQRGEHLQVGSLLARTLVTNSQGLLYVSATAAFRFLHVALAQHEPRSGIAVLSPHLYHRLRLRQAGVA